MKITKNKRIYAATGSIDEMLNQFNKRIDELSASDITSSTDTDDDKDYIAALKNKISDKFKSKISSCEYDYDDENYYFTVTSGTDVYEYTVPKDDLIGDEEKDAEYICSSIEEDINEDEKKSQTVKSSQYSDDTEYDPEGWTATDVVRNMYNSFPEVEFIDERDMGENVALYFKLGKDVPGVEEFLSKLGIDYRISNGMLRIVAPEDEEYE